MIGTFLSRVRALLTRGQSERDLNDEVREHLDLQAADFERRGMTPEAARLAARRAFGGVEQMKGAYRDRRGLPWIEDAQQDLRYAVRGLGRSPGFASIAVLTLAVGIGANAAIFSLVDAILLRPLPVRQPDELVLASYQMEGRRVTPFAAHQFRALRTQRDVLAGLSAFRPLPVGLSYRGETEMALGQLVSGNYHGLLGVSAALGRTLTEADDAVPGSHPVAVISEGYWQRRFGGAPTVIGESIQINGLPFTIVGVTSRDFTGTEAGRAVDVTIPLSMQVGVFGPRPLMDDASEARWLYLIGRLAPGVSRERATVPLALTWDQLLVARARSGRTPAKQPFTLLDGAQGLNDLRERFSLPLRVLMAMVVLVLLIACGNLATLLIARSSARRHEVGLRLALGATRGRLLRQLLTESLLLSVIGGAVGIALAYVASGVLVQLMSGREGAIVLDLAPNARTLTFTLLVSLVAGIVFGSVPSLSAARFGIATAARSGASPAHAEIRWSQATIAAQVALSVLVLVEAGLFARSLSSLRGLDTGFTGGRTVLLANIRPSGTANGMAGVVDLFKELSARSAALHASAVTFSMDTPFGGLSYAKSIDVAGRPSDTSKETVWFNFVGPRFFETLGIPLEGRDIRADDDERAPAVVVISGSVAGKYFPGVNAVGKRIRVGDAELEVVGVAADVNYNSLNETPTEMIYLPYFQARDALGVGALVIGVRAASSADETAAALRREVRTLSRGALIARLVTLDELMNGTLARERVVATLSVAFAAVALFLGCIGLYGTLAYTVTRRTSELGVRIALGAHWSRLVGMVLGESLRPVAVGIALGLPIAFIAGRLSESLLFGVTGRDPITYIVATTMLVLSASCAAWLPARRAASVNPIVALRSE